LLLLIVFEAKHPKGNTFNVPVAKRSMFVFEPPDGTLERLGKLTAKRMKYILKLHKLSAEGDVTALRNRLRSLRDAQSQGAGTEEIDAQINGEADKAKAAATQLASLRAELVREKSKTQAATVAYHESRDELKEVLLKRTQPERVVRAQPVASLAAENKKLKAELHQMSERKQHYKGQLRDVLSRSNNAQSSQSGKSVTSPARKPTGTQGVKTQKRSHRADISTRRFR
jgi:hypothetical protein